MWILKFLARFLERGALWILSAMTIACVVLSSRNNISTDLSHPAWASLSLWQFLVATFKLVEVDLKTSSSWESAASILFKATIAVGVIKAYLKVMESSLNKLEARWRFNHQIVFGDSSRAADVARALANKKHKVTLIMPAKCSAIEQELSGTKILCLRMDGFGNEILKGSNFRWASNLWALSDHDHQNTNLCSAAVEVKRGWVYRLASQFFSRKARSGNSSDDNSAIYCHAGPKLKQQINPADFFGDRHGRVCLVNEFEIATLQLLQKYPPDRSALGDETQVHVLLIGFGSIGQTLCLQLAYNGHYPGAKKPGITVVDPDFKSRKAEFKARHPTIEKLLEFYAPIEERVDCLTVDALGEILDRFPSVTVAYVCTRDESVNFIAGRTLDRWCKGSGQDFKIVMIDPPGGQLIKGFAKDPLQGKDSTPRLVVHSLGMASGLTDFLANEDIARALHRSWLVSQREQFRQIPEKIDKELQSLNLSPLAKQYQAELDRIHDENSQLKILLSNESVDVCDQNFLHCVLAIRRTLRGLQKLVQGKDHGGYSIDENFSCWEDLADDVRQSNRMGAAHLPFKLRIIGYEVSTDEIDEIGLTLTDEQIKFLAPIEHQRWMADRLLLGWRELTAAERKPLEDHSLAADAKKLMTAILKKDKSAHPLILSFDKLPCEEQEKDEEQIRVAIGSLALANTRVRKIEKTPAELNCVNPVPVS